MPFSGYDHFGGRHAESAAVANVLAFRGVLAPHTKEPFSEALLFGIAGGIGCGYFVIQGNLSFGALVAVLAAYKDLASPWKELLTDRREPLGIKHCWIWVCRILHSKPLYVAILVFSALKP